MSVNEREFDRRDFFKETGKKAGIVSFALSSQFLIPRCAGEGATPTPTPVSGATYVPQVTSSHFEPEYFLEKGESDDMGIVWARTYYDRKSYHILLRGENNAPISGLETIFYKDDEFGKGIFYITDPDRKYIPNIAIPPSSNIGSSRGLSEDSLSRSGGWDWHFVTMYLKEHYDWGRNIVVQEIEESLPSWNSENVCALPGFVYLGDWSFNQLKELNTNLDRASTTISFVFPNPYTPIASGVLAGTGMVLDGVDFVVDQLNLLFPSLGIDKDEEYPIYQPPSGDPFSIFLSLASYNYCKRDEEDIKYLWPTQIGNLWRFKSGSRRYTMEIEGTKRINGKDLLVVKNTSGVREYMGFYRDAFYYYGFGDSNIGDVFFEPALKMGDNRVGIGKTYSTSSEIIAKNYPEISGSVNELMSCVERETVVVSDTPYGDCFKMREDFDLQMSGGSGGNFSTSETAEHWWAKNVGQVKQIFQGETAELVSSVINSRSSSQISSASSLESSLQSLSLPQKIAENIKRMI